MYACVLQCESVFFVTQQGQAGFMDAALRELPTKSLQEVEQHEQWYTEYCTLLESKRKAIQAWKNLKKVSLMMVHVDSFSYKGGWQCCCYRMFFCA